MPPPLSAHFVARLSASIKWSFHPVPPSNPPTTLACLPALRQMSDMVGKLCDMSKNRVILSFAPNSWYYSLLKKVGDREKSDPFMLKESLKRDKKAPTDSYCLYGISCFCLYLFLSLSLPLSLCLSPAHPGLTLPHFYPPPAVLSQIGELFPGPSKTTRAYLHTEDAVRQALAEKGFTIKRTEMTSTNFYYSRMLEAVRE